MAVQIDGFQNGLVPHPLDQKLNQRLARRHVLERIFEAVDPIMDIEEHAMTICFGTNLQAINAAKPTKNAQLSPEPTRHWKPASAFA